MKRSRVKPKRSKPRRRVAPRFSSEEWAEATALLYERSRGLCECCGQPLLGRVERHHRQRRVAGGDRLSNLMLVLPEHHAYITEHPQWARERGFILPSPPRINPLAEPMLQWGKKWVLLDENGHAQATSPIDWALP